MCVFAHIYISGLVNYTATHVCGLKTSHGTFKNSSLFPENISQASTLRKVCQYVPMTAQTPIHMDQVPYPHRQQSPEGLEDGPLFDEQEKKEMSAMDDSLGGALCGLILAGLV